MSARPSTVLCFVTGIVRKSLPKRKHRRDVQPEEASKQASKHACFGALQTLQALGRRGKGEPAQALWPVWERHSGAKLPCRRQFTFFRQPGSCHFIGSKMKHPLTGLPLVWGLLKRESSWNRHTDQLMESTETENTRILQWPGEGWLLVNRRGIC